MILRKVFRILLRRVAPAAYGTGFAYTHCDENGLSKENNELVKLEFPKIDKLSYDHLIKHSTIDNVNSASQALTIVYSAIESASKEYRKLLSQLMSLMEDTLIYEVNDDHRDMIIAVRSQMNIQKKLLTQLISHMDYVEKMAETVSVVTQSAGMDNLAMTLCQRMDDAVNHRDREISDNKKLEKEFCILEERCIKKSSNK